MDELFVRDLGLSPSVMDSLLQSVKSLTFQLLPSAKGTQAFLIHSIPANGSYKDGAVLIFVLDSELFLDSLKIHSQAEGRFAAIIDKNNTLLLSGTWPNKRIIHQGNHSGVLNVEYGKGSGRIVAACTSSETSGWEYVTGIPYSILMSSISRVIRLYLYL